MCLRLPSTPAPRTSSAYFLKPPLSTALTAVTDVPPPTQRQQPQCQCAGDTSARARSLGGACTLRLGSTPPNSSSPSGHCKPPELHWAQGSKPHVGRVVLAKLTHRGLACPSLTHHADRQQGLLRCRCWGRV